MPNSRRGRAGYPLPSRRSRLVDIKRLRYMADQIARNFEALGEEKAIASTADHIANFWDPRMKAQLLADDRSALTPLAARAVERLDSQV